MSDNDGVQVSGQRDAGKCSAVQLVSVTSLHLDEQFTVCVMTVSHSPQMLLSFKFWHILHLSPFGSEKYIFFLHMIYSRF